MRQAHLLLVTGLPGTGKSTLARALASRYRIPILTKDAVKEPLLDVIGAPDRAGSRRLSDASFAVLFTLARDCLVAGTDLVLEGNFRAGEHEPAVQALILGPAKLVWATADHAAGGEKAGGSASASGVRGDSSSGIRVAQVLCRATESVRVARLKARATDLSRHPGHRDADSANDAPPPTNAFLSLPGERFVFDSDARSAADVDSVQLQLLLDALDRWHGA